MLAGAFFLFPLLQQNTLQKLLKSPVEELERPATLKLQTTQNATILCLQLFLLDCNTTPLF